MHTCTFCGKKYEDGTGYTLFKKDGNPNYICSRKCEKNGKLKRNPAKLKWTAKYVKGTAQIHSTKKSPKQAPATASAPAKPTPAQSKPAASVAPKQAKTQQA